MSTVGMAAGGKFWEWGIRYIEKRIGRHNCASHRKKGKENVSIEKGDCNQSASRYPSTKIMKKEKESSTLVESEVIHLGTCTLTRSSESASSRHQCPSSS